MKTDDLFNQWKDARRDGNAPEGFADRAMARVRREAPRRTAVGGPHFLTSAVKAAAVAAALLVWAIRCAEALSTVLGAN